VYISACNEATNFPLFTGLYHTADIGLLCVGIQISLYALLEMREPHLHAMCAYIVSGIPMDSVVYNHIMPLDSKGSILPYRRYTI